MSQGIERLPKKVLIHLLTHRGLWFDAGCDQLARPLNGRVRADLWPKSSVAMREFGLGLNILIGHRITTGGMKYGTLQTHALPTSL